MTGTPLWLKASCRGQFTLNVPATPSMIPFPSRSSTVATTMFITSLTRPIVMRASVVLIEISFCVTLYCMLSSVTDYNVLEMNCQVFSKCQSAMTSFREENICESPRGLPEPSGSLKQANRQSQVFRHDDSYVRLLLLLLPNSHLCKKLLQLS